jgi:hypothetical protein
MRVKGKLDITDYHTEEKITMVWPRQKDARGENTKIIYGMDTRGETKKEDVQEKRGRKEYTQP